ncbi:hypothetical protein [Paenarthrobacter sp. YJN-5]|uniref:hypothetical protein n=1 Tax=Paenarthrobacter sp. YJN-5 TaxID=2735316 RepID=UPI0018786E97|nr:hypothetical protein [Paenarthrobacter sp. YJN-5]QOT19408.1 hypothetical protein HMI59_22405 [Paenarthrobacter sp. YJN-5]
MPEQNLKPVTPGRLNKPAWYRTRTAETGPETKNDDGTVTTDVYLDGEHIGSVKGGARNKTVREWAPNRIGNGVRQHGTARFQAIDALVRTYLTELDQHPIAHLPAAA